MGISNIMKITEQIQHLFRPKPVTKELYLSLTVFHKHIAGCVWSIGQDEVLDVAAFEHAESLDTSWGKRIEAADEVLSKLQDVRQTTDIHKTVLGFAPEFLTKEGNVAASIRPDLKRMTTMLELQPVGFVGIETAIIFQIKHEEGVPPSVILLHVAGSEMEVSLYRVGTCVGTRSIKVSEYIVEDVETAIKSFPDIEILPSRMILYGAGKEDLESIKAQLLTHQWTSRANFLHYPTIDVFQLDDVSHAVALAGASELTATFIEEKRDENETIATVIAQQGQKSEEKEIIIDEKQEDEDIIPEVNPEDANVIPVAPESLGFHQNKDILEEPEEEKPLKEPLNVTSFGTSVLQTMRSFASRFKGILVLKRTNRFPIIPIAAVLIVVIGITGFLYYLLPKATVTLTVVPNSVKKEKTITISTSATAVDAAKFIIPGKKLEQSVSGEKVSPVTGKKRIGDPGKGMVVIYNKAVSSRTLKKGTILVGNSLQFTLDNDTEIASASESIGSITFGKTTASITASSIGEEGNITARTEFIFKDTASSILTARNDQPFTGGTSKETTVVTRADYDAMVKALTDELVIKAKSDLLAGVAGGEKLIDQTIKTAVTNKTFTEELDQEAKDLHGKVTITISGVSYNEQDVKSALLMLASSDVPGGYVMNEGRTVVNIGNPIVKKDGSITALASITLVSIPNIDVAKIRNEIVGKTIIFAETVLKNIQGIGSAEFFFARSLTKNRFPIKAANISVDVVVQ
ncbi:MAG: hypothetical protein V1917_04345 [Candidatus Gottesmanbacteria bacterium]